MLGWSSRKSYRSPRALDRSALFVKLFYFNTKMRKSFMYSRKKNPETFWLLLGTIVSTKYHYLWATVEPCPKGHKSVEVITGWSLVMCHKDLPLILVGSFCVFSMLLLKHLIGWYQSLSCWDISPYFLY